MYSETLLVDLLDTDKRVIEAFASCKSNVEGEDWISTANNGRGTLAIKDIIGDENNQWLPVAVWHEGKIFALDLITWLIDQNDVEWDGDNWSEVPGFISRKHIAALKYLARIPGVMENIVLLPPVYDSNKYRFRFPEPDEAYQLTIIRHRQRSDGKFLSSEDRKDLFFTLLQNIKADVYDVSDFFYDEQYVRCELLQDRFAYLDGAMAVMHYVAQRNIPPSLVTSAEAFTEIANGYEGDEYTTTF